MAAKRKIGPEGQGSSGDMKDRFRGVYKPGANPAPEPGLRNPVDVIKGLMGKKRKKKGGSKPV